jgi:hypothetical protein
MKVDSLQRCKKGLLWLGQKEIFSDDCLTFNSKLLERPENRAIDKA